MTNQKPAKKAVGSGDRFPSQETPSPLNFDDFVSGILAVDTKKIPKMAATATKKSVKKAAKKKPAK